MVKKKVLYKEGDWFGVPLRTGGFGLGIIARSNGKGILVGYFFGPKREYFNFEIDTLNLIPSDTILILQLSHLGLVKEEWPIIGHSSTFSREKWPLPLFARIDDLSKKAWCIKYNEDTLVEESSEPVSIEIACNLPRDSLSGYIAVQIKLSKALETDSFTD